MGTSRDAYKTPAEARTDRPLIRLLGAQAQIGWRVASPTVRATGHSIPDWRQKKIGEAGPQSRVFATTNRIRKRTLRNQTANSAVLRAPSCWPRIEASKSARPLPSSPAAPDRVSIPEAEEARWSHTCGFAAPPLERFKLLKKCRARPGFRHNRESCFRWIGRE